jgi:diguanylate cyclase (GGDEF)-like protein
VGTGRERVEGTSYAGRARVAPRRSRRAGVAALAALLAAAAAPAAAPAVPSGDDPLESGSLLLRVFRDSDGLPQNTVHAIALDRRGYLWIGTQDGAARYDGRGWTVVNLPDRTRSNFVRAIVPGHDGDLWFGTQGGLMRLNGDSWRPIPGLPQVLVHQRVNAVLETDSAAGTALWVATHGNGLWREEGGTWRSFGAASGLPSDRVWALYESTGAPEGRRLWVGTEGGLVYLPAGSDRFVHEEGSPRGSVNSLAETIGPDGVHVLWASTYGAGVARRTNGAWRYVTTDDGLPSNFGTSVVDAAPGAAVTAVWVGTDGGGLARLEGDRARTLKVDPVLPSNAVYSLARTGAADGTEALWVGTRNGGLARLREGQWRSFRPIPAAPWLSVNAVLEGHGAGSAPVIWFGMDGGGLARLERGRWSFHTTDGGELPSNDVQCLLETVADGKCATWVGTRNGGLTRITGDRSTVFDRASGALPNNIVQALLETDDGDGSAVWVGTRGGLAVLRGGVWSQVPADVSLPDPSVAALASDVDEHGRRSVWVGTAAGLAQFEAGRWRRYGAELGLLNDTVQALHCARSPGGRRVLFIGTDGGGLSCLDVAAGKLLFTLTDSSEPALPNNVVYQVLEDRGGHLYVSTNKGVARLTTRPGGEWERGSFDVFTFTWEDGLPSNQCNRGAGMVDSRGRVWTGTVGGAAVLDSSSDWVDRTPKRLALDGRIDGPDGRELASGAALDFRQRHLRFDYVLLSFFRERETAYRTQLVGLEKVPSAWGAEVSREYRALPPGAYSFRVWGRDYVGNVSGPQELVFAVFPAPWQTWWAYLLAAAAICGVIALAVRGRLRAHERRELELQRLVDARTRELSEANDLLVELSYLDPVTGVANRRRFDERLEIEWKRAARGRTPLSVVMIDIDRFKDYNDTYGHQQGDFCLKAVAGAIADGLPRAGDSVARFGGEEFAVVLPLTALPGAVRVAEQLRMRVERLAMVHTSSSVARVVTISCGVASMVPGSESELRQLVRMADDALYRAKERGRNRTEAVEQ